MNKKDWIVTHISRNYLDNKFPLLVEGINLNHDTPEYGETKRYFASRVQNVFDSRYDIGKAVIEDDVPLVLLQECRK